MLFKIIDELVSASKFLTRYQLYELCLLHEVFEDLLLFQLDLFEESRLIVRAHGLQHRVIVDCVRLCFKRVNL
jgi:hypothetical protein